MSALGDVRYVAAASTALAAREAWMLHGTPFSSIVWRRIPGSRLVSVPEAGHLVQEDAPELIVAALLNEL